MASKYNWDSINDPLVRDYLKKKMEQDEEVVKAEKMEDYAGLASLGSRALNDLANSKVDDVVLGNSMRNLGKAPEVVKGERKEFEDILTPLASKNTQNARLKRDEFAKDYDQNVKLRDADKEFSTERDELDPASEKSKGLKDWYKQTIFKGRDIPAQFDSMNYRQLKEMAPQLEAMYAKQDAKIASQIEAQRRAQEKAADRAHDLEKIRLQNEAKIAVDPNTRKQQAAIKAAEASAGKKQTVFDDLRALRKGTSMTGPVAGRLGQVANDIGFGVSEDFDKLNTKQMNMLNAYIKEVTGASATESEMRRLSAVMPSVKDTDDLFENKMQALEDETNAIINEKRAEAGLAPIDFKRGKGGASGGWDQGFSKMVVVSNGEETLEIPESDLADAQKDGYKLVK